MKSTSNFSFNKKAAFIGGENSKVHQWWIVRKTFLVKSEFKVAKLYLTSGGNHVLHINGQFVSRGPARSFDFSKSYDVLDVSRYIQTGSNVITVTSIHLEEGAVIAQLEIDGYTVLYTDRNWKVKMHPSFDLSTTHNSVPLEPIRWIEECFDGRQQEDWNAADFKDDSWCNAKEIAKVGQAPFDGVCENSGGLLTEDIGLPKKFAAIEWAEDRNCYRFRLEGDSRHKIEILITEIISEADEDIKIYCKRADIITVNGRQVSREVRLKKGSNLVVCVNTFGETELLFETDAPLAFGAKNIREDLTTAWCVLKVESKALNFPWHINGENVLNETEEVSATTCAKDIGSIPEALIRRLEKIDSLEVSTAFIIENQIFYGGQGCFAHPAIKNGTPRVFLDNSFCPLENKNGLLHTNSENTRVLPNKGKNVHFVLDFGTEYLGYIEFSLNAGEGTIIDMEGFEVIDGAGIYWMQGNSLRYICRNGWQTFTSYYPRGFRYISVTVRNFLEPVDIQSVCVRHSTHAVEEIGNFECDDAELNRIFEMSVNTAKLCMQDTYIDCPAHEQAYWVGDARITALINLIHFGGYGFNQNSIRLVEKSLSQEYREKYRKGDPRYSEGKFMTIPAYSTYVEGGLPIWSFMWVLQCYEHYLYGGNVEDLKENFEYVVQFLKNCTNLTNERGLFDMPGAWNLIEWGNNDLSPYGEVTASNALLAKCYEKAAEMSRALHNTRLEEEFSNHAQSMKTAINQYCWSNEKQGYVDTVRDQFGYNKYLKFCASRNELPMAYEKYLSAERISEQTNTLALICGCVPPKRKAAIQNIVRRVERGQYVCGSPAKRSYGIPDEKEAPGGIVAVGTPFFLFFSLEALFEMNRSKKALAVIKRDWGEMLEKGTKTCWETFLQNEGRWTRSICHAWSAAPAVYLMTELLGIKPLEPGFRKFQVNPRAAGLKWIKGSISTPYGPIYIEYVHGKLKVDAPIECQQI